MLRTKFLATCLEKLKERNRAEGPRGEEAGGRVRKRGRERHVTFHAAESDVPNAKPRRIRTVALSNEILIAPHSRCIDSTPGDRINITERPGGKVKHVREI